MCPSAPACLPARPPAPPPPVLQGLVSLKQRHPFLLAVDEAHATLVCGEGGGGAAEALGVAHEVG